MVVFDGFQQTTVQQLENSWATKRAGLRLEPRGVWRAHGHEAAPLHNLASAILFLTSVKSYTDSQFVARLLLSCANGDSNPIPISKFS